MQRRMGLLVVFLVVNTTACAVFDIVAFPFKLLFDVIGTVGDAVTVVEPDQAHRPAPVAECLGPGKWLVTGLDPTSPCSIACSAPRHRTQTWSWPREFAGRGEDVVVRLERSE